MPILHPVGTINQPSIRLERGDSTIKSDHDYSLGHCCCVIGGDTMVGVRATMQESLCGTGATQSYPYPCCFVNVTPYQVPGSFLCFVRYLPHPKGLMKVTSFDFEAPLEDATAATVARSQESQPSHLAPPTYERHHPVLAGVFQATDGTWQ